MWEQQGQASDSRRPLLPKPAFVTPSVRDQPTEVRAQRRQGVAIACERCRKRKIKCNGHQPCCGPCLKAEAECKYTTRESALTHRHRALQESYGALKSAVEVLCTGTEQDALNALRHMRQTQSQANGQRVPDQGTSRSYSLSPRQPQLRCEAPERSSAQSASSLLEQDQPLPLSHWTRVSSDDAFLTHVFKLFWTWDTVLSKLIHLDTLIDAIGSFRSDWHDDQNSLLSQFCSDALINAILAYAMDSHIPAENSQNKLQGRQFAEEARQALDRRQRNQTIASVQAATILSVYDEAFGDPKSDSSATWGPLIDVKSVGALLGDHLLPSDIQRRAKVQEAIAVTLSGFHGLNVKSCLIASPSVPEGSPEHLLATHCYVPAPDVQDTTGELWVPYPNISQPRISFAYDALLAETDLSRLVAECLLATDANATTIMPDHRGAVNIYDRLLNWNSSHIQRFQSPSSIIPSWMTMYVFYHWACIALLEPFIRSPFLEFRNGQCASTLIQMHSESIIFALIEYDAAFSVWHDLWISYACGIAVKHLLLKTPTAGPHGQVLWKGCEMLYKAGQNIPQVNRILHGLRVLAEERAVLVSAKVKRLLEAGTVRVRPTRVCNTSYLRLGGDNLSLVPADEVVFGQSIAASEK